jgi:hypothetical protein
MPPDLAKHGGHQVTEERFAESGVIAVHGFDQTQGGDLSQILVFLPAIPIAPRESGGERQVTFDHLGSDPVPLGAGRGRIAHRRKEHHADPLGLVDGTRQGRICGPGLGHDSMLRCHYCLQATLHKQHRRIRGVRVWRKLNRGSSGGSRRARHARDARGCRCCAGKRVR